MSLNWREIDAVLDELELVGSFIQQVVQPDFRNLYLEVFRPADPFFLRVCLETGRTRLHREARRPAKPKTRQRFAQFLSSRVKGARILGARQINGDRLVRIDCERSGECTIVWLRLWGGAANCIVTDADGVTLDAFFRRPSRGEVSGGRFVVEENPQAIKAEKLESFTSRWPIDVNAHVAAHYRAVEQADSRTAATASARASIERLLASARRRVEEIDRTLEAPDSDERYRHFGDLIMSNIHRIEPGSRWVTVEDYADDGRSLTIELDPKRSPHENGARYYDRARRSTRRRTTLVEERDNLTSRVEGLERELAGLEERTLDELTAIVGQRKTVGRPAAEGSAPGLQFDRSGFLILVGRNARENDELLRRHVRGNDLWLHTRDYPGGYVFVKCPRGKTVPLDVLLDAGNLAVFFSKARANGAADLYYTHVKHLRRAKEGPLATVLPTHEKNLAIRLDAQRLQTMLSPGEHSADDRTG